MLAGTLAFRPGLCRRNRRRIRSSSRVTKSSDASGRPVVSAARRRASATASGSMSIKAVTLPSRSSSGATVTRPSSRPSRCARRPSPPGEQGAQGALDRAAQRERVTRCAAGGMLIPVGRTSGRKLPQRTRGGCRRPRGRSKTARSIRLSHPQETNHWSLDTNGRGATMGWQVSS